MQRNPWEVATWRFEQITPLLDKTLTQAEREAFLKEKTTQSVQWHTDGTNQEPTSKPISRATLFRWLKAYQEDGLQGLMPTRRKDRGQSRIDRSPWIDHALALLYEQPDRSLSQLLKYLEIEFPDLHLSRSTLDRQLAAHPAFEALRRRRRGAKKKLRDRYETEAPHEIWQLDGKGPFPVRLVSGKRIRVHVLTVLDDHTRAVLAAIVAASECIAAAVRVFRRAARIWGLSKRFQFDRGSAFESMIFRAGLGQLGIHRNWVKERNPEAQGKIEAYHRWLNRAFVNELAHQQVHDLEHLEALLQAAIEVSYQHHFHREIKKTPHQALGGKRSDRQIAEAELLEVFWDQKNVKSHPKTGVVKLPNGLFRVPARYAGRRCAFRYDPARDDQAVLVIGPAKQIPLAPALKKRPFENESSHSEKWGAGQLQKLYDHWKGKERPVAPPGFGLPEVFGAIGKLLGHRVPQNEQEAVEIRSFYREHGPLPAPALLRAIEKTGRALGAGRPVGAYLDYLARLIRADRNRQTDSKEDVS